jgi:hypothetical protein
MSAFDIIEKSQKMAVVSGLESVSVLKIIDAKGRERDRKLALATISDKGVEKTIMKFLEPADVKGTGILIHDYEEGNDDMWIYMPALRKTRRIVSREKNNSFMGSEFTNADMSVPTLSNFTYSKEGSDIVQGVECMEILTIPENSTIEEENGFSKKVVYVGKNDFLVRQVDYYDLDGNKEKILVISGYRLIDKKNNKYVADLMKIENLENGRKSILKMEDVQLNNQPKEELFTIANLER